MARKVHLETQFARLLTMAAEAVGAEPKPLQLKQIKAIEKEFDCRIPDPVLGYFAAGLADQFGTGSANNIAAMKGLTAELRDTLDDLDEGSPRYNPEMWVIFEEDNANYLGFSTTAARDEQTVHLFDHEGMYTDTPIPLSLGERLREFIRDSEGADATSLKDFDEFEVVIEKPIPKRKKKKKAEPEGAGVRVEHPKFGPGTVLSKDTTGKHEKWNVAFDSGEEMLMLARFLDVVDE